jgi:hypothetical protein
VGFDHRKMEDQRRQAAEEEAAARRATDAQVLEDAERLIAAWNERQSKRMPMLFSPTIGAAITAGYWFLWVRCPGLPYHERSILAWRSSSDRVPSTKTCSCGCRDFWWCLSLIVAAVS